MILRLRERNGTRVVLDADFLDGAGVLAARLEGAEFTAEPSLRAAFARREPVRP